MATDADNVRQMAPAWNGRRVMVFHGQHDTHISTGELYETRTLASLFSLDPTDLPKMDGLAFIPSTYDGHDGRNHAVQRAEGRFVALCGDVDRGNQSLERIEAQVRGFVGDAAWLIYSSAHSRPDDQRWRIIIPLAEPLPFEEWHDAQHAFFNFMEYAGIDMDRALDRAAQPVYLPNVPAVHGKTGIKLRGEDGKPLYYVRATSGTSAPGLPHDAGQLASGMEAIARKRIEDDRERERIRAEAEKRRANRPRTDDVPVMEDFNRNTPIANLLELYGYKQSPRHPEDWRSPHQTGESFATRIMGEKWVSLSQSDASSGLGEKCAAGCYGDAYDLFVHYEHGGDHKSAFRALYAERRASTTISAPPPLPPDDPGPQPLDAEYDLAPEDQFIASVEEVLDAESADIKTVDAFDFEEGDIPPRPWIIPGVMLAGYTHMLAAPGGSGKSLFTLQLAISLATGNSWGDMHPRKRCRTLVVNVEDDMHEQRRRLSAARRVMDVPVADVRGRIYLAEDAESIVVARADPNKKTVVATPVVDALRRYIMDNDIQVLIVDPFAETFEGDENSNSEVKWAMKIWRDQIARPTGCAVYLVHHTTKGAAGKAGDADIVRGGGAIVNSTRISSTLMPMTSEEAEAVGINSADRHLYVRFDDAKANQSLKSGHARWFEKISVQLSNGSEDAPADEVGALKPWRLPSPFDGITVSHLKLVQQAVGGGEWRENQQANKWVGYAVADALMMDADDPKDRKRIIALLREWVRNDALRVVENEDAKRMKRKFVEVGKWVTE